MEGDERTSGSWFRLRRRDQNETRGSPAYSDAALRFHKILLSMQELCTEKTQDFYMFKL